jgi:hypothetical protein
MHHLHASFVRCVVRLRMLAAGLAALAGPMAWAGPHEHGVVYIDVAVDAGLLSMQMRAPLESLLGFERAPRTATERQAASDLLAHLQQPHAVIQPDAAAACELQSVQIQAEVLQGQTQAARSGHAELLGQYHWRCARPELLASASVTLFERYPRTRKVQAQVAGPRGQSRVTLRPLTRTLVLGR